MSASPFRRQPGGLQRLRQARPGSVLILVVALLVLMALLGIAYLTVAHQNRISSRQHEFNTQVDMYVMGMEQVGQRLLRDNLFPPHYPSYVHDRYNPLLWTGVGENYPWPDYVNAWDDNSGNPWLADRLPSIADLNSPAGSTNPPYWRFITAPPADVGPNVSDNGYAEPSDVLPLIGDRSFHTPYWPLAKPVVMPQRSFMAPTSVVIDGTRYPALQPLNSSGVPIGAAVLAADADGDGIADSGLLKLPVPAVGGITWYGAIRIIDNCAAVNASIAWEPNPVVDRSQGLPGDFFPTNIDLAGMLLDPKEMTNLNAFRFGAAAASLTPIDDRGAARADFQFISPYDALWMQLGRRMGNPGFNTPRSKYQAVPAAEMIDLANRFCIHPTGTSLLDRLLPRSLGSGTQMRRSPYVADEANAWFNDNFAFAPDGRPNMPLRAILTTHDPVNDWAGDHIIAGAFSAFGPPMRYYQKISVNTADFDSLRRGYEAAGAGAVDTVVTGGFGPSGPAGGLAAINTIALRTNGLDVVSHRSSDWGLSHAPSEPITVFGIRRQPFITEVYATNVGDNGGYVAIELHNPYPEPITMKNYQLVVETRHVPAIKTPVVTFATVPFAAGEDWAVNAPIIPPHGYVVVASSGTPPTWVTDGPTGPVYVVSSLARQALGNELFLLRPRRADGTLGKSTDPKNTYDETDFMQLVPVDTYDFQGLWVTSPANSAPPAEWHYIRPSDVSAGKAWHFVYPGPYRPGSRDSKGHLPPTPGYTGTLVSPPGATTSLHSLGIADASVADTGLTTDLAGRPKGYVDRPIRLEAPGFPGPNPVAPTGNRFPFGGFARNGDILQIPFIGAYTAQQNGLMFIYPITKVAGLVEDEDYGDDTDAPDPRQGTAVEDVGRFCPLDPTELSATHLPAAVRKGWHPPNDLYPPIVPPGYTQHYAFAIRLLDYLTVWSPASDYLPEADPQQYAALSVPPQQVGNEAPLPATKPTTFQPYAPVQGLINVNTAPWRVLAAVPWMPGKLASGQVLSLADRRKINTMIAQAIVYYRDYDDAMIHADGKKRGHGPFHSLFQLNVVPVRINGTPVLFRDLMGHWADYEFDVEQGNLAALAGKSNVKGDFAAKFQMLTRISNLLTTRSDSFTVYVMVQGWKDAETAHPSLVAQKRSAFVVNRATLGSFDGSMGIMHVPVD